MGNKQKKCLRHLLKYKKIAYNITVEEIYYVKTFKY